jgi:hypothetical protein
MTPESEAEKKKFSYFVDDVKYDSAEPTITGALIKAKIPNFPAGYTLVLEGHGHDDDKPVTDTTIVDLTHGHPHLFLKPPANFGRKA